MRIGTVYSLKMEKLAVERQQSVVRLLLAITSSIVLFKTYTDQGVEYLSFKTLLTVIILLNVYSLAVWAVNRFVPDRLRTTMAASSIVEIILITYVIYVTSKTNIPLYLWYIF